MKMLLRLATLGALSASLPAAALAQEPPPSNPSDSAPKSDAPKPDASKPDESKPDATKPDESKPDAPKPDEPKADTAAPAPKDQPTPPSDTATTPPPPAPAAMPNPGQPGPTIPGSPDLSVATVKMDGGLRSSKLVGSSVSNSGNQQVGTMDDLILDQSGHVVLGVISVGGFLGVGGKLVAVPFSALHIDAGGKVTLPDATKEQLSKMPGFTYSQ